MLRIGKQQQRSCTHRWIKSATALPPATNASKAHSTQAQLLQAWLQRRVTGSQTEKELWSSPEGHFCVRTSTSTADCVVLSRSTPAAKAGQTRSLHHTLTASTSTWPTVRLPRASPRARLCAFLSCTYRPPVGMSAGPAAGTLMALCAAASNSQAVQTLAQALL